MRILGCMAYYRSLETKDDKFEIRGRPGVFMGYPSCTKGYKIFDPSHDKITVSRDVKFAENTFPFATKIREDEEEDVFQYPSIEKQSFEENEPNKTNEDQAGLEELDSNSPINHLINLQQTEMEDLGLNSPINSPVSHKDPHLSEDNNAANGSGGSEPNENESVEVQNNNVWTGREKRSRYHP